MSKAPNHIFFISITLLLLFSSGLKAQADRELFGKNRIQHRSFEWKYYATPNFEIYYYDQQGRLAKNIAEFIEEEYQRITDMIGYAPYTKTKIFLYASPVDLLQSNAGLKDFKYDIGGQTNFNKTHIEIAYSGEFKNFKKELSYRLAKLFIDDMMYGGLITEVFQGNVFFSLPDWFVSGAAAYIAYGWSTEMDDRIRDMLKYRPLSKVKNFNGEEAMYAGQSIWNYIAEKHGRINLSNILNYTRIIRNEEKSFMSTLGLRYDFFINDWINYYLTLAEDTDKQYISPGDLPIINKYNKNVISAHNKLSPDGKKLLYTTNKRGKVSVYVLDLETRQKKRIFKDGFKLINQEMDPLLPIVDWGDSATIGIVYPKNGVYMLHVHNLNTGVTNTKDLRRFNQVNSLDIYPNGKLAVMSVDVAGQSDLYLVSTISPTIRRLTNDAADNITPHFIPGTKKIVFSSNRPTDSLQSNFTVKDLSKNYNLFLFDIDSSRVTVERLTNDYGYNHFPVIKDQQYVYYLSDISGITNVYRYDIANKMSMQMTNFSVNVEAFDISLEQNNIIFQMKYLGETVIFSFPQFQELAPRFTQPTFRMQNQLAKGYYRKALPPKETTISKIKEDEAPKKEVSKSKEELIEEALVDDSGEEILDVNSFNFQPEIKEIQSERVSLLESIRKLRNKNEIYGPLDYQARFVADNVVTSWIVDPIYGFAPLIEYQMNDLLENHKFTGGASVAISDFSSGRIFGNYQYLGDRLDYRVGYERKSVEFSMGNFSSQKFTRDDLKFTVAYPFTPMLRFEISPHAAITSFRDSDFRNLTMSDVEPFKAPFSRHFFIGGETGFIFDNSSTLGFNRIEGTQAKMMLRNYSNISGDGLSFSNMYLDVRNYTPIFNHITFATRMFYGNFFGRNAPSYMVGATDNWIAFGNRIEDRNGADSPLRTTPSFNSSFTSDNIMFHEFVTNIRGFAFNKINGSQAAVFNAEVRFPLINPENSSVNSNFLRNLKFVGFFDIGTAWSGGRTPWAPENSINTETIKQGPYEIIVRNFKNPWLYSYGFGLRTALFGYYLKLDYAYPVEDNRAQSPRIFLSLGQDF